MQNVFDITSIRLINAPFQANKISQL